jgi:hypothetical protein
MTLVTCAACERHIRRTEEHCPFCGAAIAARVTTAPERPLPTARLGRAALLAFAATYAGAGCGGTTIDRQQIGEGGSTSGGFANGGNVAIGTGGIPVGVGGTPVPEYGGAPVYGGPPWSGGYPGSGGTARIFPPYGAPPFGGFPQSGGASNVSGASGAGGAGGGGGSAQGGGGTGGTHANEATDGGVMDGGVDAEPDAH